jgi:protein TonB
VSLRYARMWLVGLLLAVLATTVPFAPVMAVAQDGAVKRKIKSKVTPDYPELAHRMSIVGKVRIAVVIAPNGTIRNAKLIGGHPILVDAAMDAVKKWKYEPSPNETSDTVEVVFEHH